MPFLQIYLPRGLDDEKIAYALKEITAAGDAILENTLARMIRIGVYESDPEKIYQGGEPVDGAFPTVLFRVGPGRSLEAKNAFMAQIADILHQNLGCPKEHVRCHIMDNEAGHHFVIGGKPKDFSKKVK